VETSCVFCKIAKGELPTDIVDQSKNFVVFEDINPHAPIHLLITSKQHFRDISDLPNELWVEAKDLALRISREKNLGGFRLVHNSGEAASIHHFQLHFLGNINNEARL